MKVKRTSDAEVFDRTWFLFKDREPPVCPGYREGHLL